jgi:2-keto-4-pentenoate hydratase/2-oxohepta-3-ene-1,7-dioic acid hydratase in catechol pathway
MNFIILRDSKEPIPVSKIICIGQNYAEHAMEINFEVPKSPVFFLKPPTAIIHNGESIILPTISNDVHHEVELTVLIGEGGKNIPRESALKYIAGYGIGLDMTMRDVQLEAKKKGLPWTLAKGFDTAAPLSDFIPTEKISNPGTLCVQLKVNGKLRQSSSTSNLIFPVDTLIAYISKFITLERGDVIYTGTPEGVSRVDHGDRLEAALLDTKGNVLVSLSVNVQQR